LAEQLAELEAAGCAKVFREKVSGAKTGRAELHKLMGRLEPGDVLIVTRFDRLARSTRDLVAKSRMGRYDHTAWAADADSPRRAGRELIRSRTGDGRKRAQACGVRFGRISGRKRFSDSVMARCGPGLIPALHRGGRRRHKP
jgi:Resolvase, N terminal domain